MHQLTGPEATTVLNKHACVRCEALHVNDHDIFKCTPVHTGYSLHPPAPNACVDCQRWHCALLGITSSAAAASRQRDEEAQQARGAHGMEGAPAGVLRRRWAY